MQGGGPSKSHIGIELIMLAVQIAIAVAWSWREGRGEPAVVPQNETLGQILPTQPPTLEAAFSENITTSQISPPEIDLSGALEAINRVKESINDASRRAEQSRSPDMPVD
jgi:hypothetical protein